MRNPAKLVLVTVELTDAQAWNLALFLKRAGFADFRFHAEDEDQAYSMRDAAELVRDALADSGYTPV